MVSIQTSIKKSKINQTIKLLTQKCDDVINTQQARRSEWNKTRDLLGFNTEPSILKTHLCGSQFDL